MLFNSMHVSMNRYILQMSLSIIVVNATTQYNFDNIRFGLNVRCRHAWLCYNRIPIIMIPIYINVVPQANKSANNLIIKIETNGCYNKHCTNRFTLSFNLNVLNALNVWIDGMNQWFRWRRKIKFESLHSTTVCDVMITIFKFRFVGKFHFPN